MHKASCKFSDDGASGGKAVGKANPYYSMYQFWCESFTSFVFIHA